VTQCIITVELLEPVFVDVESDKHKRQEIARNIQKALWKHYDGRERAQKIRSIIFNLKKTKLLRERVAARTIKADELVKVSISHFFY
jgi:hypothetical protein